MPLMDCQHSCFNGSPSLHDKLNKISQLTSGNAECVEELFEPSRRRKAMIAQARFKGIHWMLLAVFALAPTVVLAQQDPASQGQNQQDQKPPEAAQVKTEATQTQTEEAQVKTQEDGKLISVPGGKALGMSILGNQEAPKALVIVPWKQSELGNVAGISTMLDDSRLPIDKEVFMRMLSYYEIRSETTRPGGAPTQKNAAPATAAQGRKR